MGTRREIVKARSNDGVASDDTQWNHGLVKPIKRRNGQSSNKAIGNVGTLISFQVGHDDARELAGEFHAYGTETLSGLSRGQICVRSIRGGETGYPFLGKTFPEVGWWYGEREKAPKQTRRRYSRPRRSVEAKIERWNRFCNNNTLVS